MTNYSRTQKYKDLRDRLSNDTGNDSLDTSTLSQFESRLNQIDANNFAAPKDYDEEHISVHAKNADAPMKEPLKRTQAAQFSYTEPANENENDTSSFDNDFLDQYIREAKQYNIDQGNAVSENTQLDILSQLQKAQGIPEIPVPTRPYPKQEDTSSQSTVKIPTFNSKVNDADLFDEEDDIPTKEIPVQASLAASIPHTPKIEQQATQSLTKEDIMAEVQNLVNGNTAQQNYSALKDDPFVPQDQNLETQLRTDEYAKTSYDDQTTRRQILNETTQMRAQLDDYQDNLSEVSDKMNHTNQILNIVLIILIIALAVILGIVIYWLVLSKG